MQYENARPLLKSGDLLAFSRGSFKSWAEFKTMVVRLATRSTYSHVATCWITGGRAFAVEAVIPEVRIYPLSKLGNFYWLPLNAPWSNETEEFALSTVGAKYSQWAAIKAFFKDLGKGNLQECAAVTIAIADVDGIDLGNRQTPDAVVLQAQLRGSETIYVTQGK
jgi:hypothetical protein